MPKLDLHSAFNVRRDDSCITRNPETINDEYPTICSETRETRWSHDLSRSNTLHFYCSARYSSVEAKGIHGFSKV
jgi:hypothetical protein